PVILLPDLRRHEVVVALRALHLGPQEGGGDGLRDLLVPVSAPVEEPDRAAIRGRLRPGEHQIARQPVPRAVLRERALQIGQPLPRRTPCPLPRFPRRRRGPGLALPRPMNTTSKTSRMCAAYSGLASSRSTSAARFSVDGSAANAPTSAGV